VAFFGWLVLIGRNGISPGRLGRDHNGVSGEVTEPDVSTGAAETRQLGDAGHPPPDAASPSPRFPAIEGPLLPSVPTHRAWLWDELKEWCPRGARIPIRSSMTSPSSHRSTARMRG